MTKRGTELVRWAVLALVAMSIILGIQHCESLCDKTNLWQTQWDAAQDMIDTFRHCQHLQIQSETESWKAFVGRVGKPLDGTCVIVRKRAQNPGTVTLHLTAHNIELGGHFDGRLAVE